MTTAPADGFDLPPRPLNAEGRPRGVGVEIEFAGLPTDAAAKALARALGGRLRRQDPHAYRVVGSRIGEFTVSLDSRYVHPGEIADGVLAAVMPKLASLFGTATSYIIPCELVTGPIGIEDLHRLEAGIAALRAEGAKGTQDGAFYAFGLHFNPEAPDLGVETLRATLQAFVLLNAWLRREVAPDLTRNLLGFADPFPEPYARKLCDAAYRPDLARFIDDYLLANPTRNRDLDLLPLLTFIDEARVRGALPAEKIGRRPTFHYRLPDARVSDPGWRLAPDWNRWVAVERLAESPERLWLLSEAYLAYRGETKSWADHAARIAFA